MQQINAAKQVLTDPKKREIYDRYGLEGLKSGMGEEGSGFSGFSGGCKLSKKNEGKQLQSGYVCLFLVFDIFDLLNSGTSRRGRSAAPKGTDIQHALK
jgi:DnaJ-class molecular chaperone